MTEHKTSEYKMEKNYLQLDSIWNNEGDYLSPGDKSFKGRSTGCSCCSIEITAKQDAMDAVIGSLIQVLEATHYFKWDIKELLKIAEKERIKIRKGAK